MARALIVIQSQADRDRAVKWARGVPVGTRVEWKSPRRTIPQNDRMWAMLTDFSRQVEHFGRQYEPEQWKAIFLHQLGREIQFIPSLDGKTFLPLGLSSSDLSKEEMTDLIELIFKEGAERGVVFQEPESVA